MSTTASTSITVKITWAELFTLQTIVQNPQDPFLSSLQKLTNWKILSFFFLNIKSESTTDLKHWQKTHEENKLKRGKGRFLVHQCRQSCFHTKWHHVVSWLVYYRVRIKVLIWVWEQKLQCNVADLHTKPKCSAGKHFDHATFYQST